MTTAKKIPRVAHVVLSLANGGLEQLVVRWTAERNALAPGSTQIFCLDEPGELASELPDGVVRCLDARRAKIPWDRQAVRRLHDWLIGDGVQVVHTHNMPAQQYTALATSRTPIAHVYTQHGPGGHNLRFKDKLRSKILAHVTDRIVAVSHDTARCMTERSGIPAERIEVISNGIDEHPISNPESLDSRRKELGINPGDFVFGSLGRLAPVKAWDRFLPVFAELVNHEIHEKENKEQQSGRAAVQQTSVDGEPSLNSGAGGPPPDNGGARRLQDDNGPRTKDQGQPSGRPAPSTCYKLLLVGDGPEMESIRKQADKLGIADRVILPGFRRDARRFLELFDVFLLTSYEEGLSVALLEAMSAGLPVIATDVGDNRKALTSCQAGLILSESADNWPQEITSYICNRDELLAAGTRGRNHVMKYYTAASTTAAYREIYESLSLKYKACCGKGLASQHAGEMPSQPTSRSRDPEEWYQPNIVTQLRYHGLAAKLLPRWLRNTVHYCLPASWRDKTIWQASYQNIIRHAKPATEKVSGLQLGIVKDLMMRHAYYEAACLELGIDYKLVDLMAPNWVSEIEQAHVDTLLIRPFVLHSVGKSFYDERIRVVQDMMQKKIFPPELELWFYESKRRLAAWLTTHQIPHPKTDVFCRRKDAIDYLDVCQFPIVFKADLGSEALGVHILRNKKEAMKLVNRCFGRGYRQARRDHRDKQWGFIIFQEYIPDASEWRVVRIGGSFFGHLKGKKGDFHSGTKKKHYEAPPRKLLDFVRAVTDEGQFESMAVDVFETTDGDYLVSEMQVYFGSTDSFQMIVDDKKGRYLYHSDSDEYEFQEGDFCRNNCCNLRVALILEKLGMSPPMGWV